MLRPCSPGIDGAIAAETELAQARTEVREANEHMEYLSKQWTEMHADLLTERDLHEVNYSCQSEQLLSLCSFDYSAKEHVLVQCWQIPL